MKRDDILGMLKAIARDVDCDEEDIYPELQPAIAWLERLPAGCELGDVAQERANCAADVLRWADYFPDEPLMGKALRAAARKIIRDADDLTNEGKR